jgi:hypothetical protein
MKLLDSGGGDDAQAPVLSARHLSIAAHLREMIGEGPAAFFSDACLMLSRDPHPATASHIVAHLLREVESAVRSVLEPPSVPKGPKGQDGHQAKIRAVLEELGVSADDPAARFWLGLTGEGNPSGLAGRAHRSALDAPRPADVAFTEFVNGVEELLDRLLKRFKARYLSVFTRLDTLLAETPSAERVKNLRNNFPQNIACLSYFFGRAPATWLAPLAEGGYFTSPPGPVLHPDDGTAEMPFWPESSFLARVAADAPEDAVAAAIAIPATDNMRVNSDIVEVALRVPAHQSARMIPRIAELTASPNCRPSALMLPGSPRSRSGNGRRTWATSPRSCPPRPTTAPAAARPAASPKRSSPASSGWPTSTPTPSPASRPPSPRWPLERGSTPVSRSSCSVTPAPASRIC